MENPQKDQTLIELIKVLKKELIERKWAEKKASDALDYAESILDSVPGPIIVLDNEYKIISVNIPFFQLFNISIEHGIGKNFFEISNSIFSIDALKKMITSNERDIEEFELFHNFEVIGEKYFQIKCVNLQYNIKHLNFKLIIINDITDLKRIESDLRTKHMLLMEIHHRTKNNLMMIESLLKLQLKDDLEPELRQFLLDNIARISAIANVHRMIGASDNFENINFSEFIARIFDNNSSLFEKNVKLNMEAIDFQMNFDKSIYLGIVINEIITNSFKYAFNGFKAPAEPLISVVLKHNNGDNRFICIVSDNGDNEDLKLDLEKSIGLKVIHEIVETNLKGKWSTHYDRGLIHQIEFDIDKAADNSRSRTYGKV